MKISGLVSFIVFKPWRALLLGLVFVLGIGLPGIAKLSADFGYRIWFQEDNPWLQRFDAFERRFGSDDSSLVVVHSESGIFDKQSAQLLLDITEDFWRTPETIRVDSLSNFQWTHTIGDEMIIEDLIPSDEELTPSLLAQRRKVALSNPNIKRFLISDDGKTALIYLRCRPVLSGSPNYPQIIKGRHGVEGKVDLDGIRDIIKKYKGLGDHEFYVTGGAPLNYGFEEVINSDMSKLMPALFLITLVFLAVSLRSLAGGVLALVAVVFTIIPTLGFLGLWGPKINNVTAMVPQWMVAIAVAVAAHILVTFVRFRRQGHEKHSALAMTLQKNLRPTLLTSLSTAIGFLSFATTPMPPFAQMGVMAGLGTMFAWFVMYFILSPLLSILPNKTKPVQEADVLDPLKPTPRAMAITDFLYKQRKALLGLFTASALIFVGMASKVVVNSDPFSYFDPKFPLSIANHFVEDRIGGSMAGELVIEAGEAEGAKNPEFLKKVDGFQKWLEAKPFVSKTVSIIDIIKDVNKSLNDDDLKYRVIPDTKEAVGQMIFLYTMGLPQGMDINDRITGKNDAVRITAMWSIHSSTEMMKFVKVMKDEARRRGLGEIDVTGKNLLWQSINEEVVTSFVTSLGVALLLISGLMIFGLSSWRIGLVALIPNFVPLIFGGAFLYAMGWDLDIGTVLVASICLGIAVDDTIHFLANFSKYIRQGHDAKEAVARVMAHTAPALMVTTVVLVASFGSFMLGSFVPNQRFGAVVAAVLGFALVMDLTVLPALLMSIPEKIFKGNKSGNMA